MQLTGTQGPDDKSAWTVCSFGLWLHSGAAGLSCRAGANTKRPSPTFLPFVQVFCFYEGSRDVNPGYNKSLISTRPFGVHLDVAGIMAKQVRMERQDTAHIAAVSFDKYAVHAFQQYVQSAHAFSIKRCGLLYGHVGEDKVVYVDAVYEPEQSGQSETITFNLHNTQVRHPGK